MKRGAATGMTSDSDDNWLGQVKERIGTARPGWTRQDKGIIMGYTTDDQEKFMGAWHDAYLLWQQHGEPSAVRAEWPERVEVAGQDGQENWGFLCYSCVVIVDDNLWGTFPNHATTLAFIAAVAFKCGCSFTVGSSGVDVVGLRLRLLCQGLIKRKVI